MTSAEGGLSLIVRSGDYESVHYALALASAAVAAAIQKALLHLDLME